LASQKGIEKWKQKKWFNIYAPHLFNDKVVCEMPANDEKAAMGRNINIALSQLTGNPSHAYTNVVLKVSAVEGNTAKTTVSKVELLNSYIRSLVKRGRSVSNAVLETKSKDNVPMVAKILVVTYRKTTHANVIEIRRLANEFTSGYFSSTDANEIVSAVIEGRMQAELTKRLNRVVPINKVEMRKLEVGIGKKAEAA
jgi:small subunit ribosomal protein S3Ae